MTVPFGFMDRHPAMVAYVLNGGQVRRWHTWPMIKDNTVAEHSFGVAWWCTLIYEFKPSVGLLMAAISHDLSEFATGDMPAQVKLDDVLGAAMGKLEAAAEIRAGMPGLMLTEEERTVLLFADKLDGIACMWRERRLGSRTTSLVVHRTELYLGRLLKEFKDEKLHQNAGRLMDAMLTGWRTALSEVTLT